VGDFNDDGLDDIAVANSGFNPGGDDQAGNVQVLLNDPSHPGSFISAGTYSVDHPVALAVGRFHNNSPNLDIAALDELDNTVTILRGKGDGTFDQGPSYSTGGGDSVSLAMGDFDGDGNLDLVVADIGAGLGSVGGLYLLRGNGDGTLQAPTLIDGYPDTGVSSIFRPLSVVAADFNHDGNLDVAALSGEDDTVVVAQNNGDGTFSSYNNGVYSAAGPFGTTSSTLLAAGTFDFNPYPGIAIANTDSGTVGVLHGFPDVRDLTQGGAYDTDGSPVSVAVADFNGDGINDIAVANLVFGDEAGGASILLGTGAGTFQPAVPLNTGFDGSTAVAVGNFTRDKAPDLVTADAYGNTISVLLNTQTQLAKFEVTPAVKTTTPGSVVGVTVRAEDAFGDTIQDYAGTVHFTSTDFGAGLPDDYTFTSDLHGVQYFGIPILYSLGYQTITVTDTAQSNITGTSGPIQVLSWITVNAPAPVRAGLPFNVTVTVMDSSGVMVDPNFQGTVAFSSTDASASLPPNYTFTSADKGVHTFARGVTWYTAGIQTLTVADPHEPTLFNGATPGIEVLPGPAQEIALLGPSTGKAGAPFEMVVSIRDAYGNIVTDYQGTITFASSDQSASLPAPYSFTSADGGTHTFTFILQTGGTISASATATTATITGTTTVNNPVPSITGLSASSATEGDAALVLTLEGSGFVGASTVQWNGISLSTTFVNNAVLRATIPAADFAEEGSAAITVVNPAPGGGTSKAVSFTINDAALTPAGQTVAPIAGAPFTGLVASFTDADPAGTMGDYTALLNWGDGKTSMGTIAPAGNGAFSVTGTHTYAAAAAYAVTVSINDAGGSQATAHGTANVTNLGSPVQPGQSAGVGYWASKKGQALIDAFNDGPADTGLANWLAATFANLYGVNAGSNNLTGKTNAQVAAFYLALFSQKGPKLDAQVLDTGLDVYATTLSLGGTTAKKYGFQVTAYGLGADSVNVGSSGAAFGVANIATLNVYQILLAADSSAVHGILYNGNEALQSAAASVFGAINAGGGI
jgi:hypothetical protein